MLWFDESELTFVVDKTQVLPPRNDYKEPSLPAWDDARVGVEVVQDQQPPSVDNLLDDADPVSGVIGYLVAVLVSWLRGRLGQR